MSSKMTEDEIIYSHILAKSYSSLMIWERIVSKYSLDEKQLPAMKINDDLFKESKRTDQISLSMKNVTPVGTSFRRDKSTMEDLVNADSLDTHFNIMETIRNPNGSDYEVDLQGDFLHQIQDLNKYVLTFSSSNDPHLKVLEKGILNNLGIAFYTTEDIANKILEFISEQSPNYQYSFLFPSKKQLIWNYREINEIEVKGNKKVPVKLSMGNLKNKYIEYAPKRCICARKIDNEENRLIDKLAYCDIADTNIDRRNLYIILYQYLQKIISKPLYDENMVQEILHKDRRYEREIRAFTDPNGIILRSSDGKEISMMRAFAERSGLLKNTLNTTEIENTTDWDDTKLQNEPLPIVEIPVNVEYDILSIIHKYLSRESPQPSFLSVKEFTDDFVSRLDKQNLHRLLEAVKYLEIPELISALEH